MCLGRSSCTMRGAGPALPWAWPKAGGGFLKVHGCHLEPLPQIGEKWVRRLSLWGRTWGGHALPLSTGCPCCSIVYSKTRLGLGLMGLLYCNSGPENLQGLEPFMLTRSYRTPQLLHMSLWLWQTVNVDPGFIINQDQ